MRRCFDKELFFRGLTNSGLFCVGAYSYCSLNFGRPVQIYFDSDVCAGSGRDSSALAGQGWDVVAVEPAAGFRELGQDSARNQSIHWLDVQLPDLGKIRKLSYRFDLILVSAVWMHIPPTDRERAFRIQTELLAPGGMLVITLRHGPGDGERLFTMLAGKSWRRLPSAEH